MNETILAMKEIRKNESHRSKSNKSTYVIWVSILFAVIAFAIFIGMTIYGIARQRTYWKYVAEFSASTVYAYNHEGLVITEGNTSHIIEGEDVYLPYKIISRRSFGKKWGNIPEGENTILFEFGDGSSLEVWDTPVEKNNPYYRRGLYIRYRNPEGKLYEFDVQGVTCDDLHRLIP